MPKRGSDATIDLLAGVDLFSGLSRRQLALVKSAGKEERFNVGQVIAAEGSTRGRGLFYLITSGTAKVTRAGRARAMLGPGDYFGEIAVIDGGPRSATVIASTDVSTLSIASFILRPLLREHPDVLYKLLVRTCARLRDTENKLTS